jgi:DNA-binding beta-propeller fold protein YncE
MKLMHLAVTIGVAAGSLAMSALARDVSRSGPAANGSPAWAIEQVSDTDIRSDYTAICREDAAKLCAGRDGSALRICLATNKARVSPACQTALAAPWQGAGNDQSRMTPCDRSIICNPRPANNVGVPAAAGRTVERVMWKSTPLNMGYQPTYPYELPPGGGGATSVSMDSKGNLWVLQRVPPGMPELFKFGPDRKLQLALDDTELGHHTDKAHGIRVDPEDNVWVADANGSTVRKISPEGKLLFTLGTHGRRGDWDESRNQRLLWQPLAVAFARDGSVYIAQGHANESPNDVGGPDPANRSGASRILHLTKDGRFIRQWYGNVVGPGKFYEAHDIAVDPRNGDIWIGDREEYRFVVYPDDGKFVKTVQTRNLTCNVAFDAEGNLWQGTGQDGQLLRIDRDGKVLGAIGNGRGPGIGQVGETGYITWDGAGNIITGSTGQDRITVWVRPQR